MGINTGALDLPSGCPSQLMARVQGGDSDAIQTLIATYRDQIFKYLYRWLGNRDDALDVTQEVLFRIYEKAHQYDGTYPLKPWIYRVAANLCTDHFRKKNYRLYANQVEFDDSVGLRPSTDQTPENQVMHREAVTRVKEALQELPPRQRQVLEMRLLDELRLREIAEAQGISMGTVKSTLHSALGRLRKKLADYAG